MKRLKYNNALYVEAMSRSRADFIYGIDYKIHGAMGEYYKYAYAKRNHLDLADHWYLEFDRIINKELPRDVLHTVKGIKNKRAALVEIMKDVRSVDATYREWARIEVLKDYNLSKLEHGLEQSDIEKFYEIVEKKLDHLASVHENGMAKAYLNKLPKSLLKKRPQKGKRNKI